MYKNIKTGEVKSRLEWIWTMAGTGYKPSKADPRLVAKMDAWFDQMVHDRILRRVKPEGNRRKNYLGKKEVIFL